MNLDTISNYYLITEASIRVQSSGEECPWVIFGYNNKSASEILTLEVSESGSQWRELLETLNPQKIQYVYLKLDAAIVDGSIPQKTKFVLTFITWLGDKVDSNILSACEYHPRKVRELINEFDCEMSCKNKSDVLRHIENLKYKESFARIKRTEKDIKKFGNKIKPSARKSALKPTIVFAGCGGAGKSSVVSRMLYGISEESYNPTIEETYSGFSLYKAIQHSLTIIDTGGQHEFDQMNELLYHHCHALVLVYSILSRNDFEDCSIRFYSRFKHSVDSTKVVVMLLGNKQDEENRRVVTYEEGQDLAKRLNIPLFYEVSALRGTNIQEAFQALSDLIAKSYAEELIAGCAPNYNPDVIKLGASNVSNRLNPKCCK